MMMLSQWWAKPVVELAASAGLARPAARPAASPDIAALTQEMKELIAAGATHKPAAATRDSSSSSSSSSQDVDTLMPLLGSSAPTSAGHRAHAAAVADAVMGAVMGAASAQQEGSSHAAASEEDAAAGSNTPGGERDRQQGAAAPAHAAKTQQAAVPAPSRPTKRRVTINTSLPSSMPSCKASASAEAAAGQQDSSPGPGSAVPLPAFDLLELPEGVLHRLFDSLVPASNAEAAAGQLRRAARLGSTCRRLRWQYAALLQAKPMAALHAEAERASVKAKRRLVRRLTLDQHSSYIRKEVVAEFGLGTAGLLLLAGMCSVGPPLCLLFDGVLNFAAFTFIHIMIHTAIQAAAYRTCAACGTRCAVVAGLAIIVGYYCVATALAQRLLGITSLPAHLDLQPWGRRSQPHYPLAMAIWPFFGTSISWRAIHVVSNSFAWCYGVVEWNREYSYVKSRNGLWR